MQFLATIEQFNPYRDSTLRMSLIIPAEIANQIKPNAKTSFRVKGTIDALQVQQLALIPIGQGDFCMFINSGMRKVLRKEVGDRVMLNLEEDTSEIALSEDLLICLEDEPQALNFFGKISKSNQRYYSKWIEDAKTIETKSKRIAMAIEGLRLGMDYGSMIRYHKGRE